jgi:uncharacterized protein (DUF2236 family)
VWWFTRDVTPVLGGGRAILLQIADPVVAAGVRRHSDFVRRPQVRLLNTLAYIAAVVVGSPEDAAIASGFVNRAHRPVVGADDIDRQLWVAATLYDSAVRFHEELHGPIAPELAQRILDAYEPLGTSLSVPAGRWPATPDDFRAYWDDAVEGLDVTDDARAVARDLLHPRLAPAWIRATMPLARIVTVGLLPAVVREAYGFAWGPGEERRYRRTLRGVRVVAGVVPGPLRRLPMRLVLLRLRRAGRASG